MIGIWLSIKTTVYGFSGFGVNCSRIGPDVSLAGDFGAEPSTMATAISPFSAVDTAQPIRVSMRFISIRVSGSSSTTRTGRFESKKPGEDSGRGGGDGCLVGVGIRGLGRCAGTDGFEIPT